MSNKCPFVCKSGVCTYDDKIMGGTCPILYLGECECLVDLPNWQYEQMVALKLRYNAMRKQKIQMKGGVEA